MNTMQRKLFVLAVVLVAVGGVADAGRAENQAMARTKARANARTFTVSGGYSGLLAGDVMVSGRDVTIADNAVIYDVEDGVLDPGTIVATSNVALAGTIKKGKMVATVIIVSRNRGNDYSMTTLPDMLAPAGRPK